jgi:hypothetical protein
LPGGFSFGSFGGGIAKENTPIASSEQNLAIRQMGAEAAKIAASKKPTPVKISTTNPLITEKVNAKSPADILSPKSTPLPKSPNPATTEKAEGEAKKLPPVELPSVLSPRSIPLPQTPGAALKLEQQKPIQALPSMHDDAANPALSAGPIKTTQKKEESDKEEDNSEEEESSDEDISAKENVTKTQDQDPKDATKAGASVKEGEQEEKSGDESTKSKSGTDSEKESVTLGTGPAEPKAADQKEASQQISSEETSEEESEEESEEDAKDKKEVKKTQAQDPKDASKAGESVLD